MRKVAIYARVSTENQEEQKTIESQLTELRKICRNSHIVEEYVDNGYSGEILTRPGLDKLRGDVRSENCPFEALYIYDVDRLSRNHSHQGIIVEELKKRGIEIYVKDKPIEFTGEGKLLFNLLGAIAEYEKEKILERTHRGKIYKIRQKGFLGYRPPYGYSYTKKSHKRDGHFSVNKEEARVVGLIFDLYLQFQSISRVRKELTMKGIKPRKGADKWCRSTIREVLREHAYTGQGYYGKYESIEVDNGKKYPRKAKTGTRLREKDKWIPVKFPPIISKEKFNLAQQILSKKYKPFGKSKNFYLLSGLIRCALCRCTFTGSTNGRKWKHRYYTCTNRRRRSPYPKDCNAKHIRADTLEPAVWSAVSKTVTNHKLLTGHISYLAEKITNHGEGAEEEEKSLTRKKENIAFKKKRLEALYFKGLKSINDYEEKMKEFNKEEDQIDEEIEKIRNQKNQSIDKSLILRNLKGLCNLARKKLNTLSPEQRQQFLRYLIEEIRLNSNTKEAKIIGYVPVQEQDFKRFFAQMNRPSQCKIRPLYELSRSHVQYSTNPLRFELEIKV